jgi:hypothetical protein
MAKCVNPKLARQVNIGTAKTVLKMGGLTIISIITLLSAFKLGKKYDTMLGTTGLELVFEEDPSLKDRFIKAMQSVDEKLDS